MTGYMAEMRKLVGHKTVIQCAASIICIDDTGKLLLGRRSDNHMWGYSGGAVEIDENAEDCAKRELLEEMGITAEALEFFCVNSGPETHYIYPNGDEVSNFEIVYLCRKWHGRPEAKDGEMEELKFFSIDEIDLNQISPPTRRVVADYIGTVKRCNHEYEEKFYFEVPTISRKDDAIDYIDEFKKYGSEINGTGGLNWFTEDYEGWLKKLDEDYVRVPNEEKVPARTYFLVRNSDKRIVGMINIRLVLNERLKKFGGNIGYSIRPTERGKGYNNINLYLGLKVCNLYGIREVLLDADLANPASWRTMEAMGGIRIREHYDEDNVHCMVVDYKIDVKKALTEHSEYDSKISFN